MQHRRTRDAQDDQTSHGELGAFDAIKDIVALHDSDEWMYGTALMLEIIVTSAKLVAPPAFAAARNVWSCAGP